MPEPAPEIDLRDDGTVNLTFALPNDKTWKGTLRRPTIGELRHMEESLGQANNAVADALARLPAYPAPPARRDFSDADEFMKAREEYESLRGEYEKARDEFNALSLARYTAWFREVVATLGKPSSLPEDDGDLPPWAVTGSLSPVLLNHWSAVPLPVATR